MPLYILIFENDISGIYWAIALFAQYLPIAKIVLGLVSLILSRIRSSLKCKCRLKSNSECDSSYSKIEIANLEYSFEPAISSSNLISLINVKLRCYS